LKRNHAAYAITQTLIFVVVLALVALPSLQPSNGGPSPSTFTSITTSQSAQGLALVLSLNSTSMRSGQDISMTIDEQNTLSEVNNVSASDGWALSGLRLGPCGTVNLPFGMEIIQGYYALNNVSSAQALVTLYKPGAMTNCPALFSQIDAYTFQHKGDNASVVGSCDPNPCFTRSITYTNKVSGYWTSNFLLGASFNNFHPGVYSVVGGDEWGALAVLHFLVE